MAYPIIDTIKGRMDKVIDHFQSELSTVRTGMANPNMLNKVMVDYYGSPTPLNQIAGITVQEGRILVIKPYDPSSLKDIERACHAADLQDPFRRMPHRHHPGDLPSSGDPVLPGPLHRTAPAAEPAELISRTAFSA